MKKRNTQINRWKRAGVVGLLLLLCAFFYSQFKPSPYPRETYPVADYNIIAPLEHYLNHCGIFKEHMSVSVYDATAHTSLYKFQETELMPPASCIKLLTGITALSRYGIHHTLNTRLGYQGYLDNYTLYGNLILQADADPLIYDVEPFIQALRALGIRTVYGQVHVQMQNPEPMEFHDSWSKSDMRPEHVPLLFKGKDVVKKQLLQALKQADIQLISSSPVIGRGKVTTLATESHELQDICTPMLLYSNNVLAQCLWTCLNTKHDFYDMATTDFIQRELGMLPGRYAIADGCGLSPDNRLDTQFFIQLLQFTLTKPEVLSYLQEEALPLSGDEKRSGSLHYRMNKGTAKGKIMAKTGTLNRKGATSLSGYAESANGHMLLFSVMNQGLTAEQGRKFQDEICEILTK